jgi:peptide/nickel transport system permease protein
MTKYIITRIVTGFILIFIFVSILFFSIQIALPGDYVSQYILGLTTQQAQDLRQELGLDQPILKRYFFWILDLLKWNLGDSYSPFGSGEPVSKIINATLPVSLLIFGIGTLLSFLLGQWLGKLTAWKGPGLFSGSTTFLSIALYTSFPPWLAFLVRGLVSLIGDHTPTLNVRQTFRTPGTIDSPIMAKMVLGLAISILICLMINAMFRRRKRRSMPTWSFFLETTFFWILSWVILGIEIDAVRILRDITLPIITFTLLSFGEIMLIMRTSMNDAIREDYIVTAHAKGLKDHHVRDRHAARTALLPVTSRLVISLPFIFSGMVMLEQVLSVQGIGTTLFYAVGMQNVPLALGAMIMIGIFSMGSRLILEILQASLDPRIRINNKA